MDSKDEFGPTNMVVSNFDDSVRHEASSSDNDDDASNDTHYFSNKESLKSRNVNSFNKKPKLTGIKTLLSMKENVPHNRSMHENDADMRYNNNHIQNGNHIAKTQNSISHSNFGL